MTILTRSDFDNWKQDSVTKAVMVSINERIFNAVQSLTGTPRSDLDSVNWTRGYISALESLLEINFEDTQEND